MDIDELSGINKLIKDDGENDVEIKIRWDKYNSGLLCRKTFTWVDDYNLRAKINVNSSESVELVVLFRKIAGFIIKEIIEYLYKRNKIAQKELKQTIIIINNGVININDLKGIDHINNKE